MKINWFLWIVTDFIRLQCAACIVVPRHTFRAPIPNASHRMLAIYSSAQSFCDAWCVCLGLSLVRWFIPVEFYTEHLLAIFRFRRAHADAQYYRFGLQAQYI